MKYIFGLQRSGTNFLEELVRQHHLLGNYKHDYRMPYWKHTYNIRKPPPNSIYIYKELDKWLASIERTPVDIYKHQEKNLVKLWHDHTAFWKQHALVVEYESLVQDPQAFFEKPVIVPRKVKFSEEFTEEKKLEAIKGSTFKRTLIG